MRYLHEEGAHNRCGTALAPAEGSVGPIMALTPLREQLRRCARFSSTHLRHKRLAASATANWPLWFRGPRRLMAVCVLLASLGLVLPN